jgi:transcriptional regulator with XRE-family HTH domain
MPTGKQIRAARMLVDWDADDLARRISMSRVSIQNIERGDTRPKPETIDKIIQAFSEVGIEFTENEGLRRRPSGVEIFEGPERFDSFYTFLYEHLKIHGGDVCLSVTDEGLLAKYRRNPSLHYDRMQDLCDKGTVKSFRILANKSDFASKYPYNSYKWQDKANVAPTAFYTFGDCLALITFVHSPAPYVVVLQSASIADAYRQAFDVAWDAAKAPPHQGENK